MIGIDDWDVEGAKDKIAHGGRFGKKRVMDDAYRSNIDRWGQSTTANSEPKVSA